MRQAPTSKLAAVGFIVMADIVTAYMIMVYIVMVSIAMVYTVIYWRPV